MDGKLQYISLFWDLANKGINLLNEYQNDYLENLYPFDVLQSIFKVWYGEKKVYELVPIKDERTGEFVEYSEWTKLYFGHPVITEFFKFKNHLDFDHFIYKASKHIEDTYQYSRCFQDVFIDWEEYEGQMYLEFQCIYIDCIDYFFNKLYLFIEVLQSGISHFMEGQNV